MNKCINIIRWVVGSSLLLAAVSLGLVGFVSADSDSWSMFKDEAEHESDNRQAAVDQSPERQLYIEECSACHMAYPAGFLPESSWQKIMLELDNHFGDNAELEADVTATLTGYLVANAGENSSNRRAKKFMRSIDAGDVPLRITELNYFKRKHDEIPNRLVLENPDVGSFSQCQACHGDKAEQGYFNDDTVNIPNHGRWDD